MSTEAQQIREKEAATGEEELPEGWDQATLGDLIVHALGGAWGFDPTEEKARGLPRVNVIRGTEFRRWEDDKGSTAAERCIERSSLAKRQLSEGDLVIEISGGGPDQPVGRTLVIDTDAIQRARHPLVCSNFCRQVRLSRELNPEFVNFDLRFQYRRGEFNQYQTETTNLRNLNFTDFISGVSVPIPPRAEQDRIVRTIDELLNELEKTRKRLAKIGIVLKHFRQAVLAAACSGKLTEDWRKANSPSQTAAWLIQEILRSRAERYAETCRKASSQGRPAPKRPFNLTRSNPNGTLAELPFGWEWATWNDIVDWVTYGFTRPMPHVASGISIITAKHIFDSRIHFENVDHTPAEAFRELSDKDRPRKGELLLTKDGSIGRAAIVETEESFCINQSVAVLRFGGLTAYVPYLLRVIESKHTQDLIEEQAKGTAIRHISITAFGKFPLPLPPLEEQHEIVRRVEALFKLADAIEKRVTAASLRAEKLTQAILAKAFRGELVPTEAELARREGRESEPASVLLEKIKAERAKAAPSQDLKAAPRRQH